jgi:hypothetical protein
VNPFFGARAGKRAIFLTLFRLIFIGAILGGAARAESFEADTETAPAPSSISPEDAVSTVPVNGLCSAANGLALLARPAALCKAGTPSGLSGTGPWGWSCVGKNGGSTASCAALLKVNGRCGSARGVKAYSAPTSNLCNTGNASSVSMASNFSVWNCEGIGSANGTTVSSAPTTNLCTTGSTLGLSGSGPWNWTCAGSNGGSTASCSASPASSGSTITIGETNVLTTADNGNANLLIVQSTTLSQTATIESLSFYVTVAAGNLRLGIYDATGTNGAPGALKAQTASFVPTAGWNTVNVVTPVSLAAGTYWLAYLSDNNTLAFVKGQTAGVNDGWTAYTFGAMPSTYPGIQGSDGVHWSLYATLNAGPMNGACGSANSVAVVTAPSSNLCSAGTATTVTGSGPWSWTCAGSGGGTTASCSAPKSTAPLNGACGAANGTAVPTAPTINLCSAGTASSVTGTGPWDWTCAGLNGATTTSCSASFSTAPTYPIKASTNGRYLVDKNNVPFLITGDAPHSLVGNLTEVEATRYFVDRAKFGINGLWVEIMCGTYVGCSDESGKTPDGIAPFLSGSNSRNYDISTPNPAYFQRVDDMVNLAAQSGITIFLDPVETAGWIGAVQASGQQKALTYGQYLGNRYKNFPNIIWIMGNDYFPSSSDDALLAAVMQGIAQNDPNHIQTTELNPRVSGSFDDTTLMQYTQLAGAYTYYPTYAEVLKQYNAATASKIVPIFMEEAHYELESAGDTDFGTPNVLRRQDYWTVLAGGLAGQLYGNYYTWTFKSGWQSNLDTPGVAQLLIWKNFFTSLPWYTLVPDQDHTFVTAGYGTFDSGAHAVASSNYVTAAIDADGTLGIAYIPKASTVTVNMASFSGRVTAQWFDPANGTYTQISGSPFTNTGSHQFTIPGNNSGGDPDWVLLLQTE